MRLFIFCILLISSTILVSQEKVTISIDGNETFLLDSTTLHLGAPDGSLYIGKEAGINSPILSFASNTFVGMETGRQNLVGSYNTYMGSNAGRNNIDGNFNTLIGYSAGVNNFGSRNTFLGSHAGLNTTLGSDNIVLGYHAAEMLSDGVQNVVLGNYAGVNIGSGSQSIMIGHESGRNASFNDSQIFIGYKAGFNNNGAQNIFIGNNAGFANASGMNNISIGSFSGYSNTIGLNNTFLGTNSGRLNATHSGNTFIGSHAGWESIGNENTFMGVSAGAFNKGKYNVMLGFTSGLNNGDGSYNTFIGHSAGINNTSGSQNTFIGYNAGTSNDITHDNVYIGYNSGSESSTGSENVAIGSGALQSGAIVSTAAPDFTVAVGYEAGRESKGSSNTFVGYSAGLKNDLGEGNTFVGRNTGSDNIGSENTFIGYFAGQSNQAGFKNTYIGYNAGRFSLTGYQNVYIGYNVQGQGGDNELAIDNGNTPTPLIGGDFDKNTLICNGIMKISGTAGQAVITEGSGIYISHDKAQKLGIINSLDYTVQGQNQGELLISAPTSMGPGAINSTHFLKLPNIVQSGSAIARTWEVYSDARIKSEIESLDYGLNAVIKLRPVSYFQHDRDFSVENIKTTEHGEHTIGLVAQEVFEIIPEAVNKPSDETKELWNMNYDKLIPVLISSIQELNAKVEKLERKIEDLEGQY